MTSAEREVFSVSVYVGGHMRLLPLNLPAAYSPLREKIIFFSLFVSGSLGGSTGKPFLLNLPAANSPLVSLWSTSLGATAAQLYSVPTALVRWTCTSLLCCLRRLFKVKVASGGRVHEVNSQALP